MGELRKGIDEDVLEEAGHSKEEAARIASSKDPAWMAYREPVSARRWAALAFWAVVLLAITQRMHC